MTLSPSHAPTDFGTADGIISHLGEVLEGTKFLNDLKVPNDGISIVNGLQPQQARKILVDAGISV